MLASLKSVVETIRDSASTLSSLRDKRAKSEAVLELLRIYFSLTDVVADGRILLDAVGGDPRKTLARATKLGRPLTVIEWDRLIRRQATRLYSLSGRLLGQDALAVLDPALKNTLQDLIGSKFARVDNLESIGAGLVIYSMLGSGGSDWKWRRSVIVSMYPRRTPVTIDVAGARREFKKVEAALEEFHALVLTQCSKDEIQTLSKKARKQTVLP